MIFVCGGGLLVMVVFFAATISYKKSARKGIDKKENRLWFVYGQSMFLTDLLSVKRLDGNQNVDSAMKLLLAKENVDQERYIYMVKKMSVSLVVIWASLIIGMIFALGEIGVQNEYFTSLARGSNENTKYEFYAQSEGESDQEVEVDVKKRQLTRDETIQALTDAKDPLRKEVLDKNKDSNHVDKSLNLVDSTGDGIDVSWRISNSDIINYDGTIGDKVSQNGETVDLTATMTLEDETLEYTFSVCVFPSKAVNSLQEALQDYVDENNQYDSKVVLPDTIDGKTFRYYFFEDGQIPQWVPMVGILIAVLLFFLKDSDFKKEKKKRDEQLLLDYSEIVSKILLYHGAGLSLGSSMERMVADYREEKSKNKNLLRYAYAEMELAIAKMHSGLSEADALSSYGSRCGLHCYIKLSGILQQNMKRGTKEMTNALKVEVDNAMEERKNAALKRGGEISTKLLGPMVIMLVISIVIVMVPAMMSMNI